jgi:hypothetical protein
VAVRYTGDVEARASHQGGARFVVLFRWAERGSVRRMKFSVKLRAKPDPAGYDKVVRAALSNLLVRKPWLPVERGLFGRVVIRRVFQAPCPR